MAYDALESSAPTPSVCRPNRGTPLRKPSLARESEGDPSSHPLGDDEKWRPVRIERTSPTAVLSFASFFFAGVFCDVHPELISNTYRNI